VDDSKDIGTSEKLMNSPSTCESVSPANLITKNDSLETLIPRAEVPEELLILNEMPAVQVHEQVDFFAPSNLESISTEPINTNPFVGITSNGDHVDSGLSSDALQHAHEGDHMMFSGSQSVLIDEETSAVTHAGDESNNTTTDLCGASEGSATEACNLFDGITGEMGQPVENQSIGEEGASNNPLEFGHQDKLQMEEHESEACLDRDSLERDSSLPHNLQESEFDPQKEWDQPLGLPAPNKLPSAKNNDSMMSGNTEKKNDVRKAPSSAKLPQQAAGSKYQSKK
jgi:hypothetical protein